MVYERSWILNKSDFASIAIGWFMNIGYRLPDDRHCSAWCTHLHMFPVPPTSANNVQPSPRILFCPITSISERTGADVIEFHQVANFALFSTLRQPSPGTASSTQSRCPLARLYVLNSVLCLIRNSSCMNSVRDNNISILILYKYATFARIARSFLFTRVH